MTSLSIKLVDEIRGFRGKFIHISTSTYRASSTPTQILSLLCSVQPFIYLPHPLTLRQGQSREYPIASSSSLSLRLLAYLFSSSSNRARDNPCLASIPTATMETVLFFSDLPLPSLMLLPRISIYGTSPIVCNFWKRNRSKVCIHYPSSPKASGNQFHESGRWLANAPRRY